MSNVAKLAAGLAAVAVAAGAVGVVALTQEALPEVVTLQSRLAPTAGAPVEADDRPLRPEEARRARQAALRVTGGGRVSELDRSDDPGESYEVEVVENGREHDIALDEDFEVVQNRRYDD